MEQSPAQAATRLEESFRESVTEALCRLEEYRRTFDAAADAVETLLRERIRRPAPRAERDDGSERGMRITSRRYAMFWAAVLAGAMASFGAGFWLALTR
jgi:hypothetical protein